MGRLSYIEWWNKINDEGISIGEYLQKRGVTSVAIWGLGEEARRLQKELAGFAIDITYGVVLDEENCVPEVEILDRNSDLPIVDLTIVANDKFYKYIEKEICERYDYRVISIELLVKETAFYRGGVHFNKIKQFCMDNKCFYLYGAGQVGKQCLERLKKWDIFPRGFIVSQCKDGQYVEGVPLITLEQYCECKQGGIVITVGYDLHDEIEKLIKNAGISNYISYI